MDDTATVRRELQRIERQISEKQRELKKSIAPLEGQRDKLLLKLTDLEGCHDRRPVAVR